MTALATLLGPLSPTEFLHDYWPDRSCSAAGSPDRLDPAVLAALADAEAVLSRCREPVWLLRGDGFSATVPDGPSAIAFYRAGFTCYLPDAPRSVPTLRELADAVAADLGVPANCVTAEVFCSGTDSGVSIHSDHDANLAVLVQGAKRWTLAPNRHIRNQTGICRPPSSPGRDASQLLLADHLPFPESMPEDSTVVDVAAGGFVYVPRGWWHETRSSGPSLQLNLVVKGPMWVTLLTRALERRLTGDPAWREFAWGIDGTPEERQFAAARFAGLLASLAAELADEDGRSRVAEELLAVAAGRRRRPRPLVE